MVGEYTKGTGAKKDEKEEKKEAKCPDPTQTPEARDEMNRPGDNRDEEDPLNREEVEVLHTVRSRTKILTWNVRSISKDERQGPTRDAITKLDPDVLVLTETWFCENNLEFKIPGYDTVVRCDRPTETGHTPAAVGGGVLVLAKKDINITDAEPESLSRSIQTVKFVIDTTTFFGIYRTGKEIQHHTPLTTWLGKELAALGSKPFVITGDLNLPEMAK